MGRVASRPRAGPPTPQVPVALGGFMGTGKSTLGRLVARRLGLSFADLDEEVERRVGLGISEIFATRGEAAFRRYEAEALQALLATGVELLALGGGTLHQPASLALLRGCRVIVLHLDEPSLAARLAALEGEGSRPLLAGARELQVARQGGYDRAGERLDLSGLDIESAAELLERRLREAR